MCDLLGWFSWKIWLIVLTCSAKFGFFKRFSPRRDRIGNGVMTPEEEARELIDELLEAAGWRIQDYKQANLSVALGIAVREFPLKTGSADYMLFVDRKAAGVIEAKPFGTTLGGVNGQSGKYTIGLPGDPGGFVRLSRFGPLENITNRRS